MCPKAEIGHAEQGKAPNEGRTEGRNHEKSNQGRHESEKSVTNFVRNRVQDGQFVSIPENSKVSSSNQQQESRLYLTR